ncbi:MAG: hypothetical protein K6G08_06110, partial [Prevotella sp.]|nr:hypothetical protein [Prevotella sp.]
MMKNYFLAFLLTLLLPTLGKAQSLSHEEKLVNYKMEAIETEGDSYTEVTVSYLQPAKIPAQFEVRFSIWQEPDCLRPFVRVADGKGVNVDWNRLECVLINVDKEQPEPVGGYAMDKDRCWVLPYYSVRRTNKQTFKVRFSPDAFTPKVKGDVRKMMERNHLLRFCAHTFLRVDLYTLGGMLITNRPSTTPPAASSCWEADGWIPSAAKEQKEFVLGDMGNGPALGPVRLGWRLADVPKSVDGLYDNWIRRVEKENDPAVDESDLREWVTLLYYDQEHRPVLESNVVDDRIISFHVLPSATNVVTTNGVRLGSSVADYQKRFGNPMWVVSREEGKAETYYQDAFTFCTDLKNVYTRTDGANINRFKPGAVISRIEYSVSPDKVKDVPAPPKPIGTYTTTITAGTQDT